MAVTLDAQNENAIIIEAWNTVLFEKFNRFKHLMIGGLSNHSNELLGRDLYPRGSSILDVGCGFGDTAARLARDVGSEGSVVGVDCAKNFIAAANQQRDAEGISNLSFKVADIQFDDLGGPYDYAFGRFGTMFFSLPGAAMNNIRKHLKPGGRLDMIVWRKREDNPWLYEAEQAVEAIVPRVRHDQTDQVHCGPGPFSMSGADMVSSMLTGVGYVNVTFERYDADICIGHSLREAIDFAMALGPAGEIIRLAGDEGVKQEPRVREALSQVLGKYERQDGTIWAPSSTWFISGTKPS